MPEKKVSLVIIGLVMMVMLAACASSDKKPEEKVPGPGAPGPMTDKELPPPRPPEPGVAGPDVTALPPAKPKPAPYFLHTVKWRGESLSIIARWYTGDTRNWKILKEYNPDTNPNRMSEGNKIRIPEYLMKTKAPMPKEYVDSSSSKAAKNERGRPATPPGPSKDNDEEPKLFGPK